MWDKLRRIGWPQYECECCVGQDYWQGCYCAYYDAYSPCEPGVPWYARVARQIYKLKPGGGYKG